MPLQPVNPPLPQCAWGVHKVECILSWNKEFPNGSSIFAERITVILGVDFDIASESNEGMEKELQEYFYYHFGWFDYRNYGLVLDEWNLADDD